MGTIEIPTTYSFKNTSSSVLYNFCSYYWDGINRKNKVNHGNLLPGGETEIIEIPDPQIDFSFSFDPQGIEYVSLKSVAFRKIFISKKIVNWEKVSSILKTSVIIYISINGNQE